MNPVNYIFVAMLLLLSINKGTRRFSLVLLLSYIPYYIVVDNTYGFPKYASIATIDLLAGVIMINMRRTGCQVLLPYLSFIAIAVNFIGWVRFEHYYSATMYNYMSISVIIVQILILITTLAKSSYAGNGIVKPDFGKSNSDWVFRSSINDSGSSYNQMHYNSPKDSKCPKD